MSERLPEPQPSWPAAYPGSAMRASDTDRDQVATVFSTAYAEGRLTREEHDERLAQVLAAKTFGDLVPLTEDLVPAHPAMATRPAAPPDQTWTVDLAGGTDEPETMVGIFGGTTRKGRWRMRKVTRAFALFGGMDLDLTSAIFEGQVVEIEGFWCFGGMDVTVPPGLEVRDHTAGVFGGTEIRDLGDPVPGAPTLVIKGFSLFGGVSVHGPKPPKRRR